MCIRHEGRKLVLHSEELINGVIMPLPLFAIGLYLQKPIQHARGKPLGSRLAIEGILAKLCQVALPSVEFALLMRGRFVVELPVMAGDTELLNQAKLREQFRVVKDNLGEDLFVKQIQAPWPEPN